MNKPIQLWLIAFVLMGWMGCKSAQKVVDQTTNPPVAEEAVKEAATETAPIGKPDPMTVPIPFDPNTRMGKLDNGLTYYIRKNAKPENYAEFRLAINAGSILETEDQQGLAHFVEHMCFNGTRNFPKSALVDYLESIGTKFGAHLNAYTSFDETVYMLRVPTDDPEKFNKGFQIMEDWAHQVTFEGEEIEKERGVVIEEWRTRLGAGNRMQQETFPKLFYNSQYAKRLPIGTKENLETFEHSSLTNFYKDWYRPDLMALVVVGDFDPEMVEATIKNQFARIPKAENPKPRPDFEVPDHQETLITVVADDEAQFNQIQLVYKHPLKKYKTLGDYRGYLIDNLASEMLNARLAELIQSENPPFAFAGSGYGNQVRTKDGFSGFAIVRPGGFQNGLEVLLTENERALRFGFTASELERTKKSYITGLEAAFREKGKTESRNLVMEYVYHYLEGSPVPGVEAELGLAKKYFATIKVEEVNAAFKRFIRDESRVVNLMGAKVEGAPMPTEQEVLDILAKVSQKELKPYQDDVATEPLLTFTPEPGPIESEKVLEEAGITEIYLENGIRVVLKPTDFKNDEISMRSFSPGGSSLYSDDEYMSASFADQIIAESGLAGYNNVQLDKYLSDKVVRVSPYIGELYEGFNGSCSPKDLETFMQMLHLYFVQPRKDEAAFASVVTKTKSILSSIASSPENYFRSEVQKVMTNDHLRKSFFPSPEEMDQIDLETAYRIYKERFADAGDFTFIFVGNFEVAKIKPMLQMYLGSLPATGRTESWKDVGVEYPEMPINQTFKKGREPKSQVQLRYAGDFEWNGENRYKIQSAVQVLRIMMRESMREDKGGVYGVGAFANYSKNPKSRYGITISFTCSPDNVETLIETAMNDIETLKKEGASETNLQKVKETQRKDIEVGLKQNRYWMQNLNFSYQYGLDPNRILDQNGRINDLSSADVQQAIKQYMDEKNLAKFVLRPEKTDPDQ
ncbi:MAG: insulinase family protein [Bacteroidota bacterium]